MATYNDSYKTSPAEGNQPTGVDDAIRSLKAEIAYRADQFCNFSDTASTGETYMLSGTAKPFYQADEPTTRPDGTALGVNDAGSLWIDSDDQMLYSWDGVDTHDPVGLSNTTQTISGAKTFDTAGVFSAGLSIPRVHVEYQVSNGGNGASLAHSAWRTYPLATELEMGITDASLGSNQLTLPPGTYRAYWFGCIYETTDDDTLIGVTRLYDTTGSSTLGTGSPIYIHIDITSIGTNFWNAVKLGTSIGSAKFTLSEESEIEVQCYKKTSNGYMGGGLGITGVAGVYASLEVFQIA